LRVVDAAGGVQIHRTSLTSVMRGSVESAACNTASAGPTTGATQLRPSASTSEEQIAHQRPFFASDACWRRQREAFEHQVWRRFDPFVSSQEPSSTASPPVRYTRGVLPTAAATARTHIERGEIRAWRRDRPQWRCRDQARNPAALGRHGCRAYVARVAIERGREQCARRADQAAEVRAIAATASTSPPCRTGSRMRPRREPMRPSRLPRIDAEPLRLRVRATHTETLGARGDEVDRALPTAARNARSQRVAARSRPRRA